MKIVVIENFDQWQWLSGVAPRLIRYSAQYRNRRCFTQKVISGYRIMFLFKKTGTFSTQGRFRVATMPLLWKSVGAFAPVFARSWLYNQGVSLAWYWSWQTFWYILYILAMRTVGLKQQRHGAQQNRIEESDVRVGSKSSSFPLRCHYCARSVLLLTILALTVATPTQQFTIVVHRRNES